MSIFELRQHAAMALESMQKLFDYFESTEDTVEREAPEVLSDEVRQHVLEHVGKAMGEKHAHVSMTWNRPVKRVYESLGSEHPKLVPLGPITLTVTVTYVGAKPPY